MRSNHREIVIIRPPEASRSAMAEDRCSLGSGRDLCDLIDRLRTLLKEIAICFDLEPHISESQLFSDDQGHALYFSERRKEKLVRSDLLVSVNAPAACLSHVMTSSKVNPLQTAIVGSESENDCNAVDKLLSSVRIPLIPNKSNEKSVDTLQRVFPLYLSKDESQIKTTIRVMKHALLFPEIPTEAVPRRSLDDTTETYKNSLLAGPENRKHFVDERTDAKDQ